MTPVSPRRRRYSARLRGAAVALVIVLVGLLTAPASGATQAVRPGEAATTRSVPVYAYFYQWFNTTSWNRAKFDYPIAGRYSSDDRAILRRQIAQAQEAGLNGFLTSWKSTDTLNRRLQMLLDEARPHNFDVGVVYEALDFQRKPLPVTTVRHDLTELVDRWGDALTSGRFARPVVIWTGTADYSIADIRSVRDALAGRAYLLASAKSAADYQRVAAYVDGDAYYWSSANPGTPYTRNRLNALARAVHDHHGIWLAPALAGFDGRTLHHTRVVPRDHGQTLTRSLADAYASRPDAVGVISWNEWSENTYIEPGRRYGMQELTALGSYLRTKGVDTGSTGRAGPRTAATSAGGQQQWTGLKAGATLATATLLGCGLVLIRGRRRQ